MTFTEFLAENILRLDGGMGTLLQQNGLRPGESPESFNITRPDLIKSIHKAYFDCGANVVNTNTFGANGLKMSDDELALTVREAVRLAKEAAVESVGKQPKFVALDVGPTGRMLKPLGDLDFEDAVKAYSRLAQIGCECGVDLVFIETMSDSYEAKAALLGVKEGCEIPVFVSCAFGEDGKLMTGADPAAMVAMLEGLGADAIGVNCSLGPKKLVGVVSEYLKYSSLPVIVKPNAGLPVVRDGVTVYDLSAENFAEETMALVSLGARCVGGCCGTTPEYIEALGRRLDGFSPIPIEKKLHTLVSSYTHSVEIGNIPVLIGERINPTGKPKFKEALRRRDMGYILNEGISEAESGAHILDVNVGLPEIDEGEMLPNAVAELQSVVDLPLQIDTSNPLAMERALRIYNGKAMINSVSGKEESMNSIFPLAKKYGGVVIALTLDEDGIPMSAEGRVEIARKILICAERYGIDKKNIVFDPLCMAVSADKSAAKETIRAVRLIREELGCSCSLGVSNVSFGLPGRDMINSAFFSAALSAGLNAAIINPHSEQMRAAYKSHLALFGLDDGFADYIAYAEKISVTEVPGFITSAKQDTEKNTEKRDTGGAKDLIQAITRGLCAEAAAITERRLSEADPLDIINGEIVPALDKVGWGFEKKTVYLPGLLMSAEAAGAAFEVIKSKVKKSSAVKGVVVIATVKGDIHDIGKNIVKLLLENYGYDVRDLGRDISPEVIAEEAARLEAPLVGLSALMTTTVPAMEETIKLLRKRSPKTKIMVGGAVLTEEYAKTIGADKYAKDAMSAVRYAEELFQNRA